MGIDTHEVLEASSTKFKTVLLNESFVIKNYHSGANKKLRLLYIFISLYTSVLHTLNILTNGVGSILNLIH